MIKRAPKTVFRFLEFRTILVIEQGQIKNSSAIIGGALLKSVELSDLEKLDVSVEKKRKREKQFLTK